MKFILQVSHRRCNNWHPEENAQKTFLMKISNRKIEQRKGYCKKYIEELCLSPSAVATPLSCWQHRQVHPWARPPTMSSLNSLFNRSTFGTKWLAFSSACNQEPLPWRQISGFGADFKIANFSVLARSSRFRFLTRLEYLLKIPHEYMMIQ
jgi:hypothetical protein